jgi:predicted RNase H-like HicB family nuclease
MKKQKKLTILEYELPIVINEDTLGGFMAKCPKWDDCYAQGDTIEEVISEISYVASSLIELYKEEGLKIPLPLKKKKEENAFSFRLTYPVIVSG